MKEIFVVIAALLLLLNSGISQDPSIVRITKGGQNLCAEISPDEDADDAPEWIDERLNTVKGKKELVDEVAMKALNRLGDLGEDSRFNRYMVSFFGDNDCIDISMEWQNNVKRVRKVKYLKHPNSWSSSNSQLKFTISLIGIKRKANTAGGSLPNIERINAEYRTIPSTKDCYCGNDLIYEGIKVDNNGYAISRGGKTEKFSYWDKTPWYSDLTPQKLSLEKEAKCKNCKLCYREELTVAIEISPEIFDRGYLKIPSEGERYARTPTEALMYIILHELGHVEAFLSKESRCGLDYFTKLTEQDNSEESAWEFASSVMHNEEDLNAVSVFEQCISDMPNKFKSLKQVRLEHEDLPNYYSWATSFQNIEIGGLEFTSEILEGKNSSKGIGLFWTWKVYLGEKPIDADKAKDVTNEIVNALESNRILLRFDYKSENKETKITYSYKSGNNTITIGYSIGEKGNPNLPEGKVTYIAVTFFNGY